MQIPIPFNESLTPDPWSETYQRMISSLPDPQYAPCENKLMIVKSAIENIRRFMGQLKTFCQLHSFNNPVSEVLFFKSIKPRFQSQLIFWSSMFDIELQRPVGSLKHEKKYLKKRISLIKDYFERHKTFYSYYRSGQTDLDLLYFTRTPNGSLPFENTHSTLSDPLFSTSHDHLVAGILANDMLQEFLLQALSSLKSRKNQYESKEMPSSLHWTASKSGLVELVYSLYSGGVFNDGKAMVSEIASAFQEKFDIKLVNYYHTFNEIRLRKKNRTAFMDNLRDKLSKKMDELEDQ
jgi:RteC protein